MSDTAALAVKPAFFQRVWTNAFVRAVTGTVLAFAPVPVMMIVVQKLVEKPYRVVWPQLLAALLCFLGYRFFAHRIEKREMAELALPGALRQTGLGLLLGAGLVGSVFALLGLLGVYHLEGVNEVGLSLLLPLAELVMVGTAEEMVFRGIIFRITEQSLGSRWAIVISALIFGLVHLSNVGISLVSVGATVAWGVLQAALYIRTRRLWVCIGSHIAWNYCVGSVFSTAVSGHEVKAGLLSGQLDGSDLLTGAAYGVEGSLVTLIVISAAAAYFLRRHSSRV